MRIIIFYTGGYESLDNVVLPIAVNATREYDGCFGVYSEEFRPEVKELAVIFTEVLI